MLVLSDPERILRVERRAENQKDDQGPEGIEYGKNCDETFHQGHSFDLKRKLAA